MEVVIIFHTLLAALIGLLIGSHLSVIIMRFDTGESWITGRSRCSHCKKSLLSRSLIPLVSFVIQRGRCLFCRQKIAILYPVLELVTAILFVALYLRYHAQVAGLNEILLYLIYTLLLAGSVVIFELDRRHGMIPDLVTYPLIGIFVLAGITHIVAQYVIIPADFLIYRGDLAHIVGGLTLGGGIFLALVLVSRETWMGWGDVKYGVLMGLALGYPLVLVAQFFAFVLGAIYSLVMVATGRLQLKGGIIHFGPFLVIGTFIAIFFGRYILQWYL